MKAKMHAASPDEIVVTLTLTAPVREWRALREQLVSQWPSWKLGAVIRDAIAKTEERIDGAHTIESGE